MFSSLRRMTPDLRSLVDIRLVTLEDGPGRGQRLLLARNACGIAFEIAVDRGFDICQLSLGGINLGWHSAAGLRFPATDPDTENGRGFLRNFDGFMATCGLDHYSAPREVDVTHYAHPDFETRRMPMHGRISTERATLLSYQIDEEREEIVCEGIIRQASLFGEILELRRRIALPIFGNTLSISDKVTNRGYRPSRHAMLYHLNFGYPILDQSLQISGVPNDLECALRQDIPPPTDDGHQTVDLVDSKDCGPIVLTNSDLELSVGLTFDMQALPKFALWRAYQSGVFALGIEPRTLAPDDNPMLLPGEHRNYSMALTFVGSAALHLAAQNSRMGATC